MPFKPKPKVQCICKQCQQTVEMAPYKAKTFVFCSNECKWKAKEKQIPVNKYPFQARIFVKCKNPQCNQGRFILPYEYRLKRYKYCSAACRVHVMTKKFEEIEQVKEEIKQEEIKRSIWFFK